MSVTWKTFKFYKSYLFRVNFLHFVTDVIYKKQYYGWKGMRQLLTDRTDKFLRIGSYDCTNTNSTFKN